MGMVHDLSSNCCDEDVGRILVSDYLPPQNLDGFELSGFMKQKRCSQFGTYCRITRTTTPLTNLLPPL
ncbi:hypothetical protein HanRHA438_Chr03g0132571 [Helianthus annuus]|nr:hypothetical protein HanRHA438_Chr03g0132571 [Helianthus annuus]